MNVKIKPAEWGTWNEGSSTEQEIPEKEYKIRHTEGWVMLTRKCTRYFNSFGFFEK